VGVLCAGLAFCARGADNTVTDNERGFVITFPETWDVGKSKDGYAIQGKSPIIAGTKTQAFGVVDVSEVKEGISAKVYAESKDFNGNNLKNFVLVDGTEFKAGDRKGYKVVYTEDSTIPGFQGTCFFMVSGKRGYVVMIGFQKDDSGKYAKDVDAIFKSFKLIEAK
jgi:hypothetical protein